jgi:hypothetical protein
VNTVLRRAALAAAPVGMMVVSTGMAGAQTGSAFPKAKFAPQGIEVQRLTDGVHMTKEDTAPARGFTGPMSMEAKPGDPRVVVAATADLRTRMCHLLVSTDAGLTWNFSGERPAPEGYPYCTNTTAGVPESAVAWGSDGTLYYGLQAYGEGEGNREGMTSVALARTTDLGETWTHTMVNDARAEPDPKPENTGVFAVAVDTSGGDDVVYLSYRRDWSATAPDGHPLEDRVEAAVSVSTDGGDSFGEPINLNDHSEATMTIAGRSYPLHFQTGFGRPFVTAHDGVAMAVANGGPGGDGEPPEDVYDGSFGSANPMVLARSTDQGRTWEVSAFTEPIYQAAGSHTGMGWTPEGGADGTWVFAYSATPGQSPTAGRSDIVVKRSTDRGVTWTDPVAINDDDPSDRYASFYPQLDVAPNGRVDVVWQDNRDLTDYLVEVRYSYSADGGETWAPNMGVTDRPINFNFGISFNSDLRQGPGVASTDSYAAIGWADTRFADAKTQTQDNFGVVAQFAPLPAHEANRGWKLIAAVLGGLVLAGAILLGAQAARRSG